MRCELIRAELDATFSYLYDSERLDIGYITDTFPIIKRKAESAFGEYRTKRIILERNNALTFAATDGSEYRRVALVLVDSRCAHSEFSSP